MGDEVKDSIREIYESSEEYTEVETTVEGLSVAVLPRKGKREKSITLVLKPAGTWKGIYLRNRGQLTSIRELVNNPKTEQLIRIIEELSPSPAKKEKKIQI